MNFGRLILEIEESFERQNIRSTWTKTYGNTTVRASQNE
jgi:hypothetical protein